MKRKPIGVSSFDSEAGDSADAERAISCPYEVDDAEDIITCFQVILIPMRCIPRNWTGKSSVTACDISMETVNSKNSLSENNYGADI